MIYVAAIAGLWPGRVGRRKTEPLWNSFANACGHTDVISWFRSVCHRPRWGATWQSVYSCRQGPYSFEWSESPDGFNYNPLSTSENLTSSLQYATTYLRLRVTSGDGQQAFGFWTVYMDGGGSGSRMAYSDNPFESVPGTLKSYPNPADQEASFEFVLGEACDIKLELLDQTGKVLKQLAQGPYQAGTHVKTMKTAGLVNGFYLCRLSAGGKSLTNKVVVARKN